MYDKGSEKRLKSAFSAIKKDMLAFSKTQDFLLERINQKENTINDLKQKNKYLSKELSLLKTDCVKYDEFNPVSSSIGNLNENMNRFKKEFVNKNKIDHVSKKINKLKKRFKEKDNLINEFRQIRKEFDEQYSMVDDLTSRKVNIRDVRKDLITRAELNSLRDELSELKGSLRFKKKIDKLSYDVDFLKSESLDVEALHDHVESMKSKLFTREEFRKENVHTNNEIRLIVDALEDLQGSVPVKAKLDFLELELSEMEGKYITRKRFNDSRRKIIHNISELKEKINKNRKNNKSSNGDDIRKLNYQINVLKEELEESYNTFENVKYDLSREFEQKYGYTLTTNNSVKKNVKTAVSRSAKKSRKRDIRSNEPAPKLIEKVKDGVTGFFTEEIDDLPKRAVKNKSGIAHNN